MRTIHYQQIVDYVSELCKKANYDLSPDMVNALIEAENSEKSSVGKGILTQLLENATFAREQSVPMCQDTGMAVFIVELGQDCHIIDGNLIDAINEGVAAGYQKGYLRSSLINNPITRKKNDSYNTPAIIHIELVPGDQLILNLSAKGGGAENMSTLRMLKPSDGLEGIEHFILDTVREAGPNACPPLVVGVGIGGNFERCAYLAKKSLFRPVGERNQIEEAAEMELRLIHKINQLGIGPQGMGGTTTALDVKVEMEPCHIASLPVAVNLNCHANRHRRLVI